MKIALLGNPNTGKSSVFNLLTGMRQKVGNFPGVTVEKKTGVFYDGDQSIEIIDFPGTYSLNPRSLDEEEVSKVLKDKNNTDYPDLIMAVVDASRIENNLFLFTQLYDLGLPMVLVLNMWDLAKKQGVQIDLKKLQEYFPDITIISTNARVGIGKERIVETISNHKKRENTRFIKNDEEPDKTSPNFERKQVEYRKNKIQKLAPSFVKKENVKKTSKLDLLFVHPLWGYLFFLMVLMVIFQFIFSFASYPMDWIENTFLYLSQLASDTLPTGVINNLISQGIIPGIGGVFIFIPQIALLFFFIAILEETGYLSRVVFIMDRIMRPLGLNGKSIVPLISSLACAIPGVMSTRTISNWKERLITILIAPLMSCSARIPVYTLLIALVIPEGYVMGFINIQGLVLFGLYLLGIIGALLTAFVLKLLIKNKSKGFLLLELPNLKAPVWRNVGFTVLEKIKIFVFDAGKIILAISVVLWFMASYGPGDTIEKSSQELMKSNRYLKSSDDQKQSMKSSVMLEHSYIGNLGKFIEPVIEPLGYDWKMGISLITSFAAREVFVGSLSTIYAVHDERDEKQKLREIMKNEKRKDGTSTYTLASGMSLMVFYVFAMQCMSTVAVVKRETRSWKWPIIQIAFMGIMAYAFALLTFLILS
ncbi:MAG: ferrous iron transporter B [Flavobacteriales bacterium]|nr:ferrous iron transporter B [Flavobacteriales bacterium]MBT5932264.1 ferrous iron transporter B [Flavobacteriales bacterium]MDC3308615.1 ferrous iron transporter B [Crocinitomicaceae bacterium]